MSLPEPPAPPIEVMLGDPFPPAQPVTGLPGTPELVLVEIPV